MAILERVLVRLPGETQVDEPFLLETIVIVEDRLNLILNTDILPQKFESIVVDAVIKVWRRRYYEGIESEGIDAITTKFIDNVLAEYDREINAYIAGKVSKSVVRFI